jgi:hypothetical protein
VVRRSARGAVLGRRAVLGLSSGAIPTAVR